EEFFVDRGWRARERGTGRVDYERGSRRRNLLLGALSGRRFHVTARIALRAGRTSTTRDGTVPARGTETTCVHYGGGAEDGRALGGALGRSRAARVHRETSAALEQHLASGGHLERGTRG